MKRLLEFYADQIEYTLEAHGIKARVVGGKIHPRFIVFETVSLAGQRVGDIIQRGEEIALALQAPSVRIARRRGRMVIEVPRDDPTPIRLLPLLERLEMPPGTGVLGLADSGHPLLLRVDSPDAPHALIAGTTGCGKTELLRTLAVSLAMCNRPDALGLLLIGQGLAGLGHLPHLVCGGVIGGDPDRALGALASLVAEMEARLSSNRQTPRLVAVIDELADLLMAGGSDLSVALTRLTQKGRNAGIHVLAATQKPTAAVIGSLVKANFPVRIVGSVASPEDAKVASGIAGTGAEQLLGRGDFLVVAKGQVVRFQAAYIPLDELERVVFSKDGQGQIAPLAQPPRGDWREWVKSKVRLADRRGRPPEAPSEEMISYALQVREQSGKWPSAWGIREEFGCNSRRAEETLRLAAERK